MKKFNKFYFENFSFDRESLVAKFIYSFDEELYFTEKIDFSCEGFFVRKKLDSEVINTFLFSLHIALGISYYKAFPTKQIIIKSGFLDEEQINFWQKFYKNGLGEFLYKNKISPNGLFNFVNFSEKKYIKKSFSISEKALVPLGGGKDSLVSIELLKESGIEFETVVFGKMDSIKSGVSRKIGVKNLLIKRTISDNLFKLNGKGYYNGHVPITGIIAFILELSAYLYDYKYIVMSNELSANYGNLVWEDFEINHQYSKSLEFEQDFDYYINKNINSEIKYFSLLRGMYEYKIAELFGQKCEKYFGDFSSCNKNFVINKEKKHKYNWCLNCEKCAFVYIMLSAFLDDKNLKIIFSEDMLNNKMLEEVFIKLMGIGEYKPFECVGTEQEIVLSMKKIYDKKNKNNFELPYILKIFEEKILFRLTELDFSRLEKKLGKIYTKDIIPLEIKAQINIFN